MGSYVCGIDIGISGVKVVILRKDGFISARASCPLPQPTIHENERFQDANLWWKCVSQALKSAVNSLKNAGGSAFEIAAICIDGTSGTIVPVSEDFSPVTEAILYHDTRSESVVGYLNEIARDTISRLGYQFHSSFSLSKIVYLKQHHPEIFEKTRYFLHQVDYIVMRLQANKGSVLTDSSNALKTGYDILESRWPEYLHQLGVLDKLPEVVRTGTQIGVVDATIAKEFGFSERTRIIAGMTDSVAANVASGARNEGDMNSSIGSIITWKVLSSSIVSDPDGRVYSHLHPCGCYLLGGVGNSGGLGIMTLTRARHHDLAQYAENLNINDTSSFISYPLPARGERYPFVEYNFAPFTTAQGTYDHADLYKSSLEGVACIERWGYENLDGLGAKTYGTMWTTGGGAKVDVWMKIRANVLNKVIFRARFPESAYGTALIAAMCVWFDSSLVRTADNFIMEEARFEPSSQMVKKYEAYYQKFRETVEKRRNFKEF